MNYKYSEKILLIGLKQGNEEIFNYLFKHYYSGLVYFAIKIVKNKEVAEDIVQDFFCHLWYERKSLKLSKSIKSYFFISIRNRCLDNLRKRKVNNNAEELIRLDLLSSADDESTFLLESELITQIQKAIEKLPKKCRKIFVSARINGNSCNEIAQCENISIRTVECHISKALGILRKDLKNVISTYIMMFI